MREPSPKCAQPEHGPFQCGGDLPNGQRAWCGEINWTAVDSSVQDRAEEEPKRVVGVDHLHRAIR